MDKTEKQEIIDRLNTEKQKVEKRIEELKELTKPISPENAIGRVSRMDAINNKSINEAALRTAETKLKRINFALSRTDDPTFGTCTRCGNPIPFGRLMVVPGSTTCVKCSG
ncbi:MAG: TraR/DksA family transcriptional regulator [Bacteroidales bacterium]|jgi:DnaK suppressor protein|nr:TraR/DksA family transcriptional regulator [Bacteroidales bacterium]